MTHDDRVCPLEHGDAAAPTLSPDRFVCPPCTGRLRGLLTDLGATMTDLDTALARQTRFTATLGAAAPDELDDALIPQTAAVTPTPFAYGASEAGWIARQTILVWVDWVAGIRGHDVPHRWTGVGEYLQDAATWIARHPDGPQVVDELTAALRNVRRAIDRPMDRRYVGTCGAHNATATVTSVGDVIVVDVRCTEQLYARADRETVTCPRCGTVTEVRARRDAMLEQLRDHQLNAADVARAVDGLGVDINAARIRQWKKRGFLAVALDDAGNPRADHAGRPLYRVGDVLDVVAGLHLVTV